MGWFEKRRESDLRRSRARTLYDFEVECRRQGWEDPAFVYDEEHDLFRWTDGKFAFSLPFVNEVVFGQCLACAPAASGMPHGVAWRNRERQQTQRGYRRPGSMDPSAWKTDAQNFACGLLDKVAWRRGGLITFNTNISRFSARFHTSLLVILVIRDLYLRPDTKGAM